MSDPISHEQLARDYLAREFGADAPALLSPVATFSESTLEGEGPLTVFSFQASRAGQPPEDYCVVAGQTEPNYYPAWNLDPDDLFSLHVGTRFMLVMEIRQAAPDQTPPDLEAQLKETLARVAPGEALENLSVVASFVLEDQRHTVCRLRLGGEELYVLTGDLPLGIYRRIDLPPQVVYRLHLGKVIRMEADDSPADSQTGSPPSPGT